jgi:predicted nucleotidyltransferase
MAAGSLPTLWYDGLTMSACGGSKMRLNPDEIRQIRAAVEAHFGQGSSTWLFGSMLDDDARGGDVDLYVEPADPLPANLFLARQALRRELEQTLRRPVDVLVWRAQPTAFMRQARAEGQRL